MSHRLCGQSPCGLSWSKPARSTAAASLERMGSAWLPSRQNDRVTAARVLVVEDSKAIRLPVVTALSAQGFELASAANGGDLEKLLPSFAPDLVILDVMWPGRDGFELLQVVRHTSTAAVLMLTARDRLADRLHRLHTGAADYLIQHFSFV